MRRRKPGADAAARPLGPLRSLWRIRTYARPYLGSLLVTLVAALASVGAGLTVPLITKAVVDGPVARGRVNLVVPLALAAAALGLVESALTFLRRWMQNSAVYGVERAIRDDVYRRVQQMHVGFHDRWQTGQLLSRATTDLASIRRFTGFGAVFMIVNVATFATVIALLIHLDPPLGGLVACCSVPIVAFCVRFERRYSVLSRRVQDQLGDLADYAEESATGIGVLKALGRRRRAAAVFDRHATAVHDTQVAKVNLMATFWAVLDLVPNVMLVIIVAAGALAVASGSLTLGGLVAFITLLLQLVWPVEVMGYLIASAQEAATAAQRVYEVLDAVPQIADPPPARRRPLPDSGRGHLTLRDVTFGYGDGDPILRGIELDIAPGETLAVVGATGSGKSTLLALLPRLIDPRAGGVYLDDADIRDVPLAQLRAAIGYAFEEPILFSASARENITFGAPDATASDIDRAIDIAQAGFVHNLPWGLDTRIGEQGMALSGGQRQRLALARAVLPAPRLLVLDDPLSALDVHTEARIEQALADVLADTTAVLVAHRPSTVALADRVALLAGGRIRAVGTHRDLLATAPGYRDLLGQEVTTVD